MALTFLDTVIENHSPESDRFSATAAASHAACPGQACLHDRNAFYAEIIHALNECMVEGGCCEDSAQSLVIDEPLAPREWKRLLDRVLSGPIKA